jgi:hypothetical protein
MRTFVAAGLLLSVVSSLPAQAADIPVKAPPAAIVQQGGGVYFWLDGSYQSVNLPTYSLGLRRATIFTFVDQGPAESYDPRATGYGLSGAFGFLLPHGAPFTWGSNARIEIGGSYVNASAAQSGVGPLDTNFVLQRVDGFVRDTIACGPSCQTASTLNTDYSAWQVWGKTASDFKSGPLTLTPSLTVFGGNTKNDQNLSQRRFIPNINGLLLETYDVNSALAWTDVGARARIDATIDVTSWLAVSLGGSIGTAYRNASLSANDLHTLNLVAIPPSATSATSSTTVTPFLANLEASLIMKVLPKTEIKAFAGLNYDSRVPGIAAPSYSGPVVLNSQGSPASIYFQSETSFYAGGGLTMRF